MPLEMLLLNTSTLKLEEFAGNGYVAYAILSHTWEEEEVTYQDMQLGNLHASTKAGYRKIVASTSRAHDEGWQYIWIDTCCIDKSSSADLTEAINCKDRPITCINRSDYTIAMFRYYRGAGVCYAYLSDVPHADHPGFEIAFAQARWFKRGWTLQELLAPRDVIFFGKDWSLLGAKADKVDQISEITGIERGFLRGADLGLASVAKRMSWASERVTTRTEDQAYCLLGIFGKN
jgi:hypothetical protein